MAWTALVHCTVLINCTSLDCYISDINTLNAELCEDIHKYAAYVECKNKSDAGNNRANWNCLRIIQKLSEPAYLESVGSSGRGACI